MKETIENKEKQTKEQKRGLYFALAVCLLAVAVAGSATYSSVMDYVTEHQEDTTEEYSQDYTEDIPEVEEVDPEEFTIDVPEDIPENIQEEIPQESTSSVENTDTSTETTETTIEETENVAQESQMYTPSESLIYPTTNKEIILAYSDGELVYSETMGDYRAHCGIDLNAEQGETIVAVGNGVVLSTETSLLLGNVVTIEHGDYVVRYCGLGDTFIVEEGDVVIQGTPVGSASTVPYESVDEPHIHIEILKDGEYVDPEELLN